MMRGRDDYNILDHLHSVPADISVSQLLAVAPSVRAQLSDGFKKTGLDVNTIEFSPRCSSTQTTVSINGVPLEAVVDSGAAVVVVSRTLVNELGLVPSKAATVSLITADGKHHPAGEIVYDLPIQIDDVILPANAVVFDNPTGSHLILGVSWMKTHGIDILLSKNAMTFSNNGYDYTVPLRTCKGTDDSQDEQDVTSYDLGLLIEEIPSDDMTENDSLNTEDSAVLDSLLEDYGDVFANDIADLEGRFQTMAQHTIDTGDHTPVNVRPYRIPKAYAEEADKEIEKMLKAKIIVPSSSPWCAPVLPITKKDGGIRICIDYRKLNEITRKDVYPLPRIDDILDTLHGSTIFSTLDALSGYWQIPVAEQDQEKTAFAMLGKGLYHFKMMPFGLTNAPSTFQRCM